MREAKKRRINTVLETCGYGPWSTFEQLLPYLDHIYYDVKSLDAVKHREYTGVEPDRIAENLRLLAGHYDPDRIVVRTPVIPGFNDGDEEIAAIHNLIKSMGITKYELLKYHRFGSVKYGLLGKPYLMEDVQLPEGIFGRLREAAGLETGAGAGKEQEV
ncbi:4-hydroxyphenylacetate decarboxylase activating enzyme [compost metagenome]